MRKDPRVKGYIDKGEQVPTDVHRQLSQLEREGMEENHSLGDDWSLMPHEYPMA